MTPRPRHPRLLGLMACLALAMLLIGLPTVLLSLGWGPLPTSVDAWWTALTSPDDGRLTLALLKVVAWLVWALLALTILTEIVAGIRGIKAPRLPGLRWSQMPSRRLVATAMLLFVSLPAVGVHTATAAPPSTAAPTQPTAAAASQSPTATTAPSATAAPGRVSVAAPTHTHTVQRGETLWSIAEHHLGAGNRYPEIVKLNPNLLHGKPRFLKAGWVLTLPASAHAPTRGGAAGTPAAGYVVKEGDTLSAIARDHVGDADAWPQIFDASRDTVQPDGRHLTNPDLIIPGWHLDVPTPTPTTGPDPVPDAPSVAENTAGTGEQAAPTGATEAPASVPGPTPLAPSSADATLEAVPAAPASSASAPVSAPATPPAAQAPATATPDAEVVQAGTATEVPWLLAGLTGAGTVLAGGLWYLLGRRRRAQFRARRPGRTIVAPPPELAAVEKTLITQGPAAVPTVAAVDRAMRLLGGARTPAGEVPELQAVQLLQDELAVHLAEPLSLPAPWRQGGDDGRRWLLSADAGERASAATRAPYPQLVSIGQDDRGTTWMVNLEQMGVVSLTGEPTYAADFARYLAAEIAVNPWSAAVQLDCVGLAPEASLLDPSRIRHHRLEDPDAVATALSAAAAMVDRCAEQDATAATGRAEDLGGDVWGSWLVLVDAAWTAGSLDQVVALAGDQPHLTGTAVVLVGDSEPVRGVGVRLSGDGRVRIPALGLDLTAVGLTPDEATGCALLLAHADQLDDVAMPANGEEGWRASCDAAGALRPELVLPRDTDPSTLPGPAATVVPTPDDAVLEVAAATPEDLRQLSPLVPEHVRSQVEDTDPTLDADLATWLAGAGPQLRLLGPIQARTGNPAGGSHREVMKRKAFYTELLAFLALHPEGATSDQLVDAFNLDAGQMRVHVSNLRSWLGTDPATDAKYLPQATKSPAGLARGLGLYQLVGVLTDIDLFRRLRARGQARGPEGTADLQAALALVTGEPFTGQRRERWAWLADGDRVDQHMVCAVVDVAHLVTMAALHAGDLATARTASEIALKAAPYEDTPRLDLAAVVAAEGDQRAAERIIIDDVCNRSEDGDAPDDLAERTTQIVTDPAWLKDGRVA